MKMSPISKWLLLGLLIVPAFWFSACDEEEPQPDPCTTFDDRAIFIAGDFTGNSYTAMTNAGGTAWTYEIPEYDGTNLTFTFANSATGTNVTWADAPNTATSARQGNARKKVEVSGRAVCGGNEPFEFKDATMLNQKLTISFNTADSTYQVAVAESNKCNDFSKNKMWIYWRLNADAGSFGFEEMTQISPGVFEIVRPNFQANFAAMPFKFVNTNNFTQADWGRAADATSNDLTGKAVKKVIEPILDANGNKTGENPVCGNNASLRVNITDNMKTSTIRVRFDVNTGDYAWIVEAPDPCFTFSRERMWINWRLNADAGSFGFEEMTEVSDGVFEIYRTNFQANFAAMPFKFVNTNNFTQADWGRAADATTNGLSGVAVKKVITPILDANGNKTGETPVCGNNTTLRVTVTDDMKGKTIKVTFDVKTQEYAWQVVDKDLCNQFQRDRMWVNWRLNADAGSFGFEEMTYLGNGDYELVRENFQANFAAMPFKFVNTNNFTEADWGRAADATTNDLTGVAVKKVIEGIVDANGNKTGETPVCGSNTTLRVPITEAMKGKKIKLRFNILSQEYAWIVE